MPELPEVETFARGLRPLVGTTTRRVEILDPSIEIPERAIAGSRIEVVERRGKHATVVVNLSAALRRQEGQPTFVPIVRYNNKEGRSSPVLLAGGIGGRKWEI